nr:hypothetical protein EKO22_10685 [Synechococcus elongatus PCC 11802]
MRYVPANGDRSCFNYFIGMNLLFIHQNFPGQWKHLAPAMAALSNYRAVALAMHDRPIHAPGVEVRRYKAKRSSTPNIHPWSVDFESQMIRGESCAEACIQLRDEGFMPHVICAHPGWGEALFLKDVWPNAKFWAITNCTTTKMGPDSIASLQLPLLGKRLAASAPKMPPFCWVMKILTGG